MAPEIASPSQSPKLVVSGLALAFADGGVPTYVRNLVNGLAGGLRPEQMRLVVPERARLEGLKSGVRIDTLPREKTGWSPLVSEIFTDLAVGRYVSSRYPEAVFFTPHDFWALSTSRRRIAVTHDAIQEVVAINGGSALRRAHRRMCLRYARKSTHWLSVSEYSAADVGARVGFGRTPQTCPPWLDEQFERIPSEAEVLALRARLGLPEKFFLYVGGYRKFKNVELLIRAHAAAAREVPVPPLVLAGNATNLNPATQPCDVLGEMARSKCAPGSVLLPGYIAESDLPALYRAATVFVSASLNEGFGFPPVEAMAMGCPVIVANRTAFTEVVPCPHSRFDPMDEPGLVRLLIEAAATPDRFRCALPVAYTRAAGVSRILSLVEALAG